LGLGLGLLYGCYGGFCYQALEEVAKRAPHKGQRRKASYCVSDFYK